MLLRINGVVPESSVDGPGLRFTVFVQGCPHRCPQCHNPETHDARGGRLVNIYDLFAEIRNNPLLYGLTLSGGEPLCQPEPLIELATLAKNAGLNVALYTGYTFEHLIVESHPQRMRLLHLCDILVDGPFDPTHRSLELRFTGSSNQRILDLPQSLKTGKAIPETSGEW